MEISPVHSLQPWQGLDMCGLCVCVCVCKLIHLYAEFSTFCCCGQCYNVINSSPAANHSSNGAGKGEKGKSTLKVCGPKIQVESSAVAWVMELIDCFGQARHVAGIAVKTRAHYNP